MTVQITSLRVEHLVLNPAEARMRIEARTSREGAGCELRGKLMGPSCRFSSTVEIAYPLRPVAGQIGTLAEVLIPEPCLWDTQSPFLYQGTLELWQEGRLCHQIPFSHVLRSWKLGKQGLRLNGKPLLLRGVAGQAWQEDELLELRQAGCNCLLVPGPANVTGIAQQLGFVVLERLTGDFLRMLTEPPFRGIDLAGEPTAPLPEDVLFAVMPEASNGRLHGVPLPRILRVQQLPVMEVMERLAQAEPAVFGWLQSAPS